MVLVRTQEIHNISVETCMHGKLYVKLYKNIYIGIYIYVYTFINQRVFIIYIYIYIYIYTYIKHKWGVMVMVEKEKGLMIEGNMPNHMDKAKGDHMWDAQASLGRDQTHLS